MRLYRNSNAGLHRDSAGTGATVSTARLLLAASRCGVLLVLVGASFAHAARLSPERVFSAPDLNGPRATEIQVSPDGGMVTYLKARSDDPEILDLWAVEISGGAPFRLIDSLELVGRDRNELSGAEKVRRARLRIRKRGVVEYRWDEQGQFVLVPLNGDLWLVERSDGNLRRLTDTDADEIDAKVSPDGLLVSYVRDENLFVLNLASGRERALSTSGGGTLSWGTAEFIAQEEMFRNTGYWWSPDSRRLAMTRVDVGGVDVIPRFEIGATGVNVVKQRYPRAGQPNALVELYVVDLTTGAKVKVDLGRNRDIYLARVSWSRDGETLYIQRQSRDQRRLDLLAADLTTGETRVLLSETSDFWVELTDDFWPLQDGKFLWSSERSGWRHLYLYDPDGQLLRQVTHGEWPVDQIEGVDEINNRVLFMASKDSVLERHLYIVSYDEVAEPQKLTSGEGWWSTGVATTGELFTGTYSDPDTPPRTAIYSADGKRMRWIESNALDASHPYYKYADRLRIPEFGTLEADDGSDLHYAIWTPPDFDPSQTYPAIVSVYGGPLVQRVRKRWGPLTDQLLLEQGYILFKLDNRGSANRSVGFKTAIHRRLGQAEVEDQLTGVRFLSGLGYVDTQRLVVMGWSYGGFMTLMLMTADSSIFSAGIAGAAPTDWRLYDTHYTERYMGMPAENEAGYAAADIVRRLPRLHGDLLLVHGMADDNVIFENATRMMAVLQTAGRPFELMTYPGEAHLLRGNGKSLHLWRTYLDFLCRHLSAPLSAADR